MNNPYLPATGPTEAAWTYRAEIVAVIDGDTYDVVFDFGVGLKQPARLRMGGRPELGEKFFDAPEIKLYQGVTAQEKARGEYIRDMLRERLTPGTRIIVVTELDQYGREGHDQWQRLISHLYHEGVYLNDLVRETNNMLKARQSAGLPIAGAGA